MREAALLERDSIVLNVFLVPSWSQSEEDIRFAEGLSPVAVEVDANGAACALKVEGQQGGEKVSATRLGVRLVNQLIAVGGIDGDERIVAPDGSRLLMRTSRNGRFIRVARE